MPTISNEFANLLGQKKRLLLYNYQISFLVTVFRNCKKQNKKIFKSLLEIVGTKRRHWYVKVQAVNTIFYYGVGLLKESHFKKIISSRNERQIRRAALVLLPLVYSRDSTIEKLSQYAKALDVNLSRMANFLLALGEDKELALAHLRKFSQPNYVFLGDQIWRLWFIRLHQDKVVIKKFNSIVKKIKQEFRNYQIVKHHFDGINKFKEQKKTL